MQLGYELIREQLFFRKELIERLPWFIRLRWLAAGAGLAGCAVLYAVQPASLPGALPKILLLVLLYNLLFALIWRNLPPFKHQRSRPPNDAPGLRAGDVRLFSAFAHVQVAADLLALSLLVVYSGGIYSPLAHFYIFHIILTGILLPAASCYIYAGVVFLTLGAFIGLQQRAAASTEGFAFPQNMFFHEFAWNEAILRYLTLVAVILVAAFLVTSLKLSLRVKGRGLLRLSKALDESNTKLTALYEMVKEVGSCTEPQQLMDCATRQAARIMGVKACSIKLLDDQQRTLRFASTFGLSEEYTQAKAGIDIARSPINRKIIEGAIVAVADIAERDYFQYPEDIRKEGIAALICLPLRVEKMVLGVFCVYGDAGCTFAEKEIQFFGLMSDLTALALEKLNTELNRTWFLQKSAHQLRSPLHTVVSMLKTLQQEYLGAVNVRQAETIARCIKRIGLLDNLVGDLLKLSVRRTNQRADALRPVYAQSVLTPLARLFEAEARAKAVEIDFQIDDTLPPVMAAERLLDDLFSNLISNALKYTPPGGKVTVRLSQHEEGNLRLEVSDTGIGIPEADLPKLFSEFFRAENAKSHTECGTGLGLVIAKEIVDQLNGTVSVTSRPGEGSTFTCHIPNG